MQDWTFVQHLPVVTVALHNAASWPCQNKHGWGPFTPDFQLTPCALRAALATPDVFAIVALGWSLWALKGEKITTSTSLRTRATAALLLAQAALRFQPGNAFATLNTVASTLALGLAALLALRERLYSPIPSPALLLYLLFALFSQILFAFSHFGSSAPRDIAALVGSITVFCLELWSSPNVNKRRNNPYDRANIFSRLTFTWMSPLMSKGYNTFLSTDDLPSLASDDRADACFDAFDIHWRRELKRAPRSPNLYRVLLGAFGARFLFGNLCKVGQDIMSFLQPQLLRLLIAFVADYQRGTETSLVRGYYIAGGMLATSFFQTMFLHQYFDRSFGTGMRVRTALGNAIFQKSLNMASEARATRTTGATVNLMSIDAGRMQDLFPMGHIVWSGPFQIILCLVSLYNLLGNAMWAGVIVMLVCIPLNRNMNERQKKFQQELMHAKDNRTRLTSELLSNIKSVKLFAWETPFTTKVQYVRTHLEIAGLKAAIKMQCATMSLWYFCPFLVSFSTFVLYSRTHDEPLTSELIFPSIALFNLLNFPLSMFPFFMNSLIESNVAAKRIVSFLQGEELQRGVVTRLPKTELGKPAIEVQGSFSWSKSKAPTVKDINLQVAKGALVCLVGRVAAGKTSLLSAALGEMYATGSVKLHGSVAYVNQSPWVFNGSVRENITFGLKYDEVIYNDTVRACALLDDFKVLPDGDATLVGEKGISLSGGQKARIALARAVYARADIYVLDDPLSAVDEHVGRHIIDNVLGAEGLLASKAILLATNSLPVLRHAEQIYMLEDGRIVEQGAYHEIVGQQTPKALWNLIKTFDASASTAASTAQSAAQSTTASVAPSPSPSPAPSRRNSVRRASVAEWQVVPPAEVRKEHVEQGKVDWKVYKEYAAVCGPTMMMLAMLVLIVGGMLQVSTNVWLKHWADAQDTSTHSADWFLGIYGLLGVAASLMMAFQVGFFYFGASLRGAQTLHDRMLRSVLRSPMSFFETTPIGRIVNRFSNDVYKIDEALPRAVYQLARTMMSVVYTVVIISASTPIFLPFAFLLGLIYYYFQRFYLATSRELKRLESISKSPIYAQFQETLDGASTVRAYGQAPRFNFVNQSYMDINNMAYFPSISANRWLAVRLEFLGSAMIFVSALFSVYSLPGGKVSAGSIGLAVSYALNITQTLNWTVRMSVEIETNIVSVERVLEYCQLEPEAPVVTATRPKAEWPEHGRIQLDNFSTRYRSELPLILRNISLSINPGEKLGIVGRTGAGKSSLSLALFRLIEAAEGHIEIDGLNTSELGLFDLRSNLSIIPQDSQLFDGTVRSNLDPADRHTDDEIWRVLDLSHLRPHVEKMEGKLDAKVSEGGSNISGGQRQLISLARAMLTNTRVLVLDEATAAVDVETDQLIQDTIRTEFKDRTVLTIAHRLNTILDSDRILVLNYGEIAEIGTPRELMDKKDGLFYSLAKQGGFTE